jgi:dTDP-glucose pyrophosphorylase
MSIKRLVSFDVHLCDANESIKSAMKRMDTLSRSEGGRPYQFLIMVADDQRIIGTLTDGDFRRGIINGCTLEDPAGKCVHHNPVVGKAGQDEENRKTLSSLFPGSSFLPVVDEQNRIVEVLVSIEERESACFALIMTGGFGKRLGERTKNTPKPLLFVGDKPILAHLMERISAVNPVKYYLSTHYLAEQVMAFGDAHIDRDRIEYLHEDKPLGTGGSLGLLPDHLPHPIIVSNGDVLTSLDFVAFKHYFEEHDYDALVAVARHRITIPFGVIRHDETGQFVGIDEKPTLNNYVSAGVYVFSQSFRSLVGKNMRIDLPELLTLGKRRGLRVGLFPIHEYWTDVGRPEDLEKAEMAYSECEPDDK